MMTTKVTPRLTIEIVMTASMQNYDRNDDEDVDKNTLTCKTRTEMMTRKLTRTMKIR